MPLVIAQCSQTKRPGPRVALDKYKTRVHSAINAFMFGDTGSNGGFAAGWNWAIMSAGKGLVAPTTTVDDYDLSLRNQADADAWAAHYGVQVRAMVDEHDSAETILFAGSKLYLQALRTALPHRKVKHIGEGGKGCGDYFAALKDGFDMYNEDA